MKNENDGFTPGPWKVRRRMAASNFDKTPRFVVETDDTLIAETRAIRAAEDAELGYNHEETEANANLISSAPDLLAALIRTTTAAECLCSHIKSSGHDELDKVCEQARSAIAKARGVKPDVAAYIAGLSKKDTKTSQQVNVFNNSP